MRLVMVVGVLTALFMSSCSNSSELEQQAGESQEATATEHGVVPLEDPIPGFNGGCKGFRIWTQNQFQASNELPEGVGYGAKVRPNIDGQALQEGIPGNVELIAVGWFDTGQPLPEPYASNPEGIRGEVWYYVPDANNATGGWVADAGVRGEETDPAPGNRSKFYSPDQAAPQPPECELTR